MQVIIKNISIESLFSIIDVPNIEIEDVDKENLLFSVKLKDVCSITNLSCIDGRKKIEILILYNKQELYKISLEKNAYENILIK